VSGLLFSVERRRKNRLEVYEATLSEATYYKAIHFKIYRVDQPQTMAPLEELEKHELMMKARVSPLLEMDPQKG
jgi:hypothetical protein